MRTLVLAVALAAASLVGCAGLDDHQQRVGSGALIGAGAGAVIGGGRGALIGGALGGLVGNEVDHSATADQRARDEAQRRQRDYDDRYDQCRRYNSERYCRDAVH